MKKPLPLFFRVMTVLSAAAFILTMIWGFGLLMCLCVILAPLANSEYQLAEQAGIPPKPKTGLFLGIFGGVSAFLFLTPPMTIDSGAVWRYPFQRAVIGVYRNIREPEWFPDFRQDVRSDYRFSYLPSIMQGTGHYTVQFVTDPETAAQYCEKFAGAALYTVPLTGCDQEKYALRIDEDFFAEQPGNAVVYILDTNEYSHHPHSSSVTIDCTAGKIEMTQYG